MVFGGISILSKVYTGMKRTYQNIIGWYALAKTAKKIGKKGAAAIANLKVVKPTIELEKI